MSEDTKSMGKNLDFFSETEQGRKLLIEMCHILMNLNKNVPENSLSSYLSSALSKGISNNLDGLVIYGLGWSLRTVRHESAHIAGGLILGKKDSFRFSKISFRDSTRSNKEVRELINDSRFTLIHEGKVIAKFDKHSKNATDRESVYSAIAILISPMFFEIPFKYNIGDISFVEGGLSKGDLKALKIVEEFCKKENIVYDKIYKDVVLDIEKKHIEILEKTDQITAYLLPKIAAGQRRFSIEEILRGLRNSNPLLAIPNPEL